MKNLFHFCSLVLLLAGCDSPGSPGLGAAGGKPVAAPEFSLKDLSGKEVALKDLRGKPVLIAFWAVGCGPCRREVPSLIAMHKRFAKDGLVIVGVNAWDEPAETVKEFVRDQGIPYTVLLGGHAVGQKYQVTGIPTTYYVDASGLIVSGEVGLLDESEMEARVRGILHRG